jgi:hypothetical protein
MPGRNWRTALKKLWANSGDPIRQQGRLQHFSLLPCCVFQTTPLRRPVVCLHYRLFSAIPENKKMAKPSRTKPNQTEPNRTKSNKLLCSPEMTPAGKPVCTQLFVRTGLCFGAGEKRLRNEKNSVICLYLLKQFFWLTGYHIGMANIK